MYWVKVGSISLKIMQAFTNLSLRCDIGWLRCDTLLYAVYCAQCSQKDQEFLDLCNLFPCT
jgi:hypothetical protein